MQSNDHDVVPEAGAISEANSSFYANEVQKTQETLPPESPLVNPHLFKPQFGSKGQSGAIKVQNSERNPSPNSIKAVLRLVERD